jgi:hypothetical protein
MGTGTEGIEEKKGKKCGRQVERMGKKVDCRWARIPTTGGDSSQNYSKLLHLQTLLHVCNVRSFVTVLG